MTAPSIYEPIGSFRKNSDTINVDLGLLVPVLDSADDKFSRVKIKELFSLLDTSSGSVVLLFAFKAIKQKHNSDDEDGVLGDLRNLPNVKNTLDFEHAKVQKRLPQGTGPLAEIIVINFHTDASVDQAAVNKCFNDYCRGEEYLYYKNGGTAGTPFSDYYRNNCHAFSEDVQPETSGGGILVGI